MFADRLVNDEDRDWFDNLCKEKMTSDFSASVEEVINNDLILYGDMLSSNVDNKVYSEITDHAKVGGLMCLLHWIPASLLLKPVCCTLDS